MPRLSKRNPSYRKHSPSGQAVVTITVTPCSASAVIRRQNSRRARGSAPLVGSSRKSVSGSCSSAAAIARRCLNPPGNCPLGRRASDVSSNCCRAHSIRWRFLLPRRP